LQGPEDSSGQALERAIGIVLGLILGVGVVTAFVFLGSEETIDAPRISGVETQPQPDLSLPERERLPAVRVIDGAPPPSGPVRLDFERGKRVRFRVVSDAPVGIAIPGYGLSSTVDSGTFVSFRATRAGEFPVIVSASNIRIASLRISR
jgi:hypothetical protein